ncbi:MAG TPA: YfiR family protein [Vicinamibacterales bacterium]
MSACAPRTRRAAPGGSCSRQLAAGGWQRRKQPSRIARLLSPFLFAVSCFPFLSSPSSAQPTEEYEQKAAVVCRFPEFTEWPADALDSQPTIDLCVASSNPFGDALERMLADKTLPGRTFRVREVGTPDDLAGCRLLFVPAGSGPRGYALLTRARRAPVLTVGEVDGFLDKGGLVNLRLVDGRVRFDVDVGAAQRVGIRFSSQLLRLALVVRGGAEP